jgi:tetratricopeptide (TPR) repeat protein
MDRKENSEMYAEKMEHSWTQEIVLRYLMQTYPEDAAGLCDFVAHHGGFVRPLNFFAGDPRVTRRDGKVVCHMVSVPFLDWGRRLPKCKSLLESRLELAWSFHFGDDFAECMEILDKLIVEHPTDIGVLDCRADTLIHLERHQEALVLADQILKLQPDHDAAWMHRGDALVGLRKWRQVLVHCAKWEKAVKAVKADSWRRQEIHSNRATAYCAMGNEAMVDVCFEAYMDSYQRRDEDFTARRRRFFLKRVYREAGKPLPSADVPPL